MNDHRWFELRQDDRGQAYMDVALRGGLLHRTPLLNKGTAFTDQERDALDLRGLLPPRVCSIEEQLERVRENYGRSESDLARYMDLAALLDRNETLFYRYLADRLEELLPIVYTPTVGQACKEFGHIFRRGRGLYLTAADVGRLDAILAAWPADDVGIIVVTDGERILGLGDLGANGMGIPIGKLSLYVAGAGIAPWRTLPVCLDVGTNNERLLADPLYLGLRQRRLRGGEYDALLEAFLEAATRRFPRAIVQFEDFGTENAFRLLQRHRERYLCFNDDIQGTAAVVAAGVYAALQPQGGKLEEQRFVMAGAGESATGIASLLVSAMVELGVPEAEAVSRFWFVDSQGLVFEGRGPLAAHKRRFARPEAGPADLLEVVRRVAPTILIGASGQTGLFSQEVIEALAAGTPRPVVFALSNPTSQSECTPQQAYEWSKGQAVVATGSPFPPVPYEGKLHRIGQANNAFVFPGIGLGVLASGARRVTDGMFLAAARTLAALAPEGELYPEVGQLRSVSRAVAVAVVEEAVRSGLTSPPEASPEALVDRTIWKPDYLPYRPA